MMQSLSDNPRHSVFVSRTSILERGTNDMPLSSKLFQGDNVLQAAADRDSAHILQGARGPHVEKIQIALNTLDSAGLDVDGVYGQATANAVLNYKRKKDVVNRAHQSTADNIVGRMTMAKLDEEMHAHESSPPARVQLIPISPRANFEKANPRVELSPTKTKLFVPMKLANILPTTLVSIDIGQTAEVEVKNGNGFELAIVNDNEFNPRAKIVAPGSKELVSRVDITSNSLIAKVRGLTWGTATLMAFKSHLLGPSTDIEKIVIDVKDNRPNTFHPTVEHHHEPVQEPGEWNDVCKEAAKDANLGFTLRKLAENNASPETVSKAARVSLFGVRTEHLALAHFDHYLSGRGGMVNEDKNLKNWVEGSSHTRGVIAKRIKQNRRANETTVEFFFEYNATMYDDEDVKDSWGTIDRLDVFADFMRGTVELWFEDTYEWHPTYSQYTRPFKCPNTNAEKTVQRNTLFLHAAMVQMKTRGARDFKMRGNATFPMTLFVEL